MGPTDWCRARRRSLLAACACVLFVSCGPTLEGLYSGLEAVAWDDYEPFRGLWLEDELVEHPELAQAPRYHLRLEIAEELNAVAGELRVRYTNREAEALTEIPFFCFPNLVGGTLEVSAVRVGGSPVQAEMRRARSLLAVPLPEPLNPGRGVEVALEYSLRVPESGVRQMGVLSLSQGVLSLAYAYPMIPARAAWDHPLPPSYGDFVTNDAGFYVVEVSAPEDLVLVLPGVELERRSEPGRIRVLFALGPARDLFLAAGRGLVVLEKRQGPVLVRSLAPAGREEAARLVLEAAREALESFSRRFGPYPFTTFTVAAAPFGALGMEFPGITLLSLRLYDLQGELGGLPHRIVLEATLAHELAHQWFYASVGNDQLEEPWIDESLAQYCSWLYYRDRYGDGGAGGMFSEFEDRWDRVDRAPIPIGMPVGSYTPKEYSAIIYGRAPLFLHALAGHMGEESFDAFLAELAGRYEWLLVDGDEFQELAEEVCRCDLDELWAEWVDP